jgi:hypothetical protein
VTFLSHADPTVPKNILILLNASEYRSLKYILLEASMVSFSNNPFIITPHPTSVFLPGIYQFLTSPISLSLAIKVA